ncbi:MAG: flagellin [Limisphaerales bacterium]|nr:MAG: flagellin [Limisphaerales bacterium]|tara:strand:- start:148 stop:972 length:825 start_codon:yes stop_codon:yes gene_type:complete
MVINTNMEALQTANNLNASQTELSKSLSRLSSGSRIIKPSDDAAGLAVTSRLRAQIKRLDSALSNVVNAVSFTQTQDGFMKTMDKALRRMGELAMLAKDGTKSQSDLNLYQKEFQQLQDYVDNTRTKDYNAVSMFGSATLNVTVDSEGNTFAMPPIDLGAGTTNGAYSAAVTSAVQLTTSTYAAEALTKVKEAISQIAIDRAQLGAVQSRLNFTNDQLNITKENLQSAISRVADVDIATEATNYARYQILVQSGTQMLTQANNLPNAALQLLRQ